MFMLSILKAILAFRESRKPKSESKFRVFVKDDKGLKELGLTTFEEVSKTYLDSCLDPIQHDELFLVKIKEVEEQPKINQSNVKMYSNYHFRKTLL
jgi:hypothetical protein